MRFLTLVFISVCAVAATVPDRFLVQLSGDPAAIHAVRRGHRAAASDPEFRARVSELKRQHLQMRSALESSGAQVIGETTAATNVMIVRIPSDRASRLAAIPGVLRVHPVRLFQVGKRPQCETFVLPGTVFRSAATRRLAGALRERPPER